TQIVVGREGSLREGHPLSLLSSTMPKAVRLLHKNVLLDGSNVNEQEGGLVRMRWPIRSGAGWALVPREEMPYFSREQFSPDFTAGIGNFGLAVMKRLGTEVEPLKILARTVEDAMGYLKLRVQVVREGHRFCQVNDCSEGSDNYESWSTPSRDARLVGKFRGIYVLAAQFGHVDGRYARYAQENFETLPVELEGRTYKAKYIKDVMEAGLASFDPRDDVA